MSTEPSSRGRQLLWAVVALVASACAEPAFDVERLERAHPSLRAVESHRLAQITPYFLPAEGALTLFVCRWEDGEPIPVTLPEDATPAERAKLEAALAAWEGALGLRFAPGRKGGRGIELRLLDEMLAYSANTVADCAVDPRVFEAGPSYALPARMVFASIHMARGDPRLAGTALHELGHALGFQGHVGRGRTVMVTDTDAIRRAGERVARGEGWGDAALEALYAIPSGTVLARRRLGPARTEPIDRLARLAPGRDLRGPLLRVGDREGRVSWLDPRGRRVGFRLLGLQQALTRPEKLVIEPSPAAQRLLDGAP